MDVPMTIVDANIDWIIALSDYVTVRVPLDNGSVMKDETHATT
jgi:hypothetical protein